MNKINKSQLRPTGGRGPTEIAGAFPHFSTFPGNMEGRRKGNRAADLIDTPSNFDGFSLTSLFDSSLLISPVL